MQPYFTVDPDSHVPEPPDLWERYLEPRDRERAIKIRPGPNGEQPLVDGEVVLSGRLARRASMIESRRRLVLGENARRLFNLRG